jgi:hypothetical protein
VRGLNVSSLDRVKVLIEEAIDEFDNPSTTTSGLLRKCTRIANLRNDFLALAWLDLEATDSFASDKIESQVRRAEYAAHFDKDEWEKTWRSSAGAYFARRSVRSSSGKMMGGAVEELENLISLMESQASSLVPPEGLAPVDLFFRSREYDKKRLEMTTESSDLKDILSRIRARLFQFLIDTERQIEYGQVNADIFERVREYVDENLSIVDPAVLEMFRAAYHRVKDGDGESLSHALTSCRRIIKAVADALYPPRKEPITGIDGKTRSMDDSKYVNRLIQHASENIGKHGSGEVTQATLDQLGRRLRALDGLASKGVHDSVTALEVDTCVIQTYLMVGDVLRIRDSRSPLNDMNPETFANDSDITGKPNGKDSSL